MADHARCGRCQAGVATTGIGPAKIIVMRAAGAVGLAADAARVVGNGPRLAIVGNEGAIVIVGRADQFLEHVGVECLATDELILDVLRAGREIETAVEVVSLHEGQHAHEESPLMLRVVEVPEKGTARSRQPHFVAVPRRESIFFVPPTARTVIYAIATIFYVLNHPNRHYAHHELDVARIHLYTNLCRRLSVTSSPVEHRP